jgi:hypothetical protein
MGDLTCGMAARRRRFALARDHAQSSVRESCDHDGDGKRRRTRERIRMYVPRPLIGELRGDDCASHVRCVLMLALPPLRRGSAKMPCVVTILSGAGVALRVIAWVINFLTESLIINMPRGLRV